MEYLILVPFGAVRNAQQHVKGEFRDGRKVVDYLVFIHSHMVDRVNVSTNSLVVINEFGGTSVGLNHGVSTADKNFGEKHNVHIIAIEFNGKMSTYNYKTDVEAKDLDIPK